MYDACRNKVLAILPSPWKKRSSLPIVFLLLNVILANRKSLLLRRKSYLDVCITIGANPLITSKVISIILNSRHAAMAASATLKNWGDMANFRRAVNELSTSVHQALQFHYLIFWNAVKQVIPVVQKTCDVGINQLFSMLFWEVLPDMTYVLEIVEWAAAGLGYMSRHIHVDSYQAPRFFTDHKGASSALPTLILLMDTSASLQRLSINRNFVFLSFYQSRVCLFSSYAHIADAVLQRSHSCQICLNNIYSLVLLA